MRGLVVFGLLVSTVVVCVLSDTDQQTQQDVSDVAVSADQLAHGHRAKRSPIPYDPIIPALVVGKSFLLGALVGKTLRKGWGWRRPRGWGWRPHHHDHHHAHHAPVVVHHAHTHGGWGGWEPVVQEGWGWAR